MTWMLVSQVGGVFGQKLPSGTASNEKIRYTPRFSLCRYHLATLGGDFLKADAVQRLSGH
jgi:hypothetical protein